MKIELNNQEQVFLTDMLLNCAEDKGYSRTSLKIISGILSKLMKDQEAKDRFDLDIEEESNKINTQKYV